MSVSDIKTQLQELYGAEISESLISRITDEVIDEVKIWQSRPLESVYPIVYFDCLVVKVRQDKLIINKSVYVALALSHQLCKFREPLKALSHQLCKFREPLNSTIKFDHKMSHSFIPIGDRHRPFFGNIINCQI